MDDPDYIVEFAKYIVRTAIGQVERSLMGHAVWYCACCQQRVINPNEILFSDSKKIEHKPDCLYLKAKTILLISEGT